jgi:nickel-dependent lactate racemase
MRRPENGPANTETATVQVSLKYGKGSVRIEIPKDRLLEVVKPKPSVHQGQSIPEALAAPVDSEPLPRLVDRNDKVAVVVSDITRPCPTRAILPFVMRSLKASGVPRENVRILIGTGTHRGHTPAEKRALLGSYASSIPQIVDHSMDSVQYVGTTRRGTRVSVNPLLLDADFALAIGNVDVHYFAGYTGGYKAVVPGLAGKETIERNHSLMTLPNAEPAVVESNPVREDLEEAGRMTGLRYVINVVQDERKRIVSSYAGDPIAAQRAAIKTVDDLVKVPVRKSADIVVASAGGYPRDINLYQAHKAIENASHAVKNGGTIILVAECREGFGNSTFETWMTSASSLDEVGEKLSKQFILGAHKAFALSKIAKRAEIIVASNKLQANSIILRTWKKPQDALDDAWRSHGKDASILLMPYAMNTLPATPSTL